MEINIKNTDIYNSERIPINRPQWGYSKYIPNVYVQVTYNDAGFDVKFTVEEANPLCEKTKNFTNIHEDSCVEFFAKLDPEHSNKYIMSAEQTPFLKHCKLLTVFETMIKKS